MNKIEAIKESRTITQADINKDFKEVIRRKAGIDISYFPGCSMATSAIENNLSLIELTKKLGFNLVELEDWSCCGSSSTHSVTQILLYILQAEIFPSLHQRGSFWWHARAATYDYGTLNIT